MTNGLYEKLLTPKQVAKILNVDETTIRRWIKEGYIEAVKLPGSGSRKYHRIRKSTVDTILNQGKSGSNEN
jgi:excisionase family DNA binding protein